MLIRGVLIFIFFYLISGSHGYQAAQAGSCSYKSICSHFQSLWMILGSHEAASGSLHTEVSSSHRKKPLRSASSRRHRQPRMTLSVLCFSSRRREWLHIVARFPPSLRMSSPSFSSRHFPSSSIRRCGRVGFLWLIWER